MRILTSDLLFTLLLMISIQPADPVRESYVVDLLLAMSFQLPIGSKPNVNDPKSHLYQSRVPRGLTTSCAGWTQASIHVAESERRIPPSSARQGTAKGLVNHASLAGSQLGTSQ